MKMANEDGVGELIKWAMKKGTLNGCLGDLLGMKYYPGMWELYHYKDPC